jgi:hypothetical protein
MPGVKWRARELYYRAFDPAGMNVDPLAPPSWWRGETFDASIYVRLRHAGPGEAGWTLAYQYTAEYLGVPNPTLGAAT